MSEDSTAIVPGQDIDFIPRLALTVDDVHARLRELKRFIDGVFEEGVHYGKIPETDRPMIFKPGVELLLQIHSLGNRLETVKEIEDWEGGFFYYRIKAIIFDKRRGNDVCEGLGSCSSKETKYMIRWLFGNELPPGVEKDELKYKEYQRRDGSGIFRKYQWKNENLADQQNTILKMAVARALRDAGLRATFCSSLFTDKGTDWIEAGYQVIDPDTGEVIADHRKPRPVGKTQRPEQTQQRGKPIAPKSPGEPNFGRYNHPKNKPPKIAQAQWDEWSSLVDVAASCNIEIPGFPVNESVWMDKRMAWLKAEIDRNLKANEAPENPFSTIMRGEEVPADPEDAELRSMAPGAKAGPETQARLV